MITSPPTTAAAIAAAANDATPSKLIDRGRPVSLHSANSNVACMSSSGESVFYLFGFVYLITSIPHLFFYSVFFQ